jgi:hypothetical protein
MPFNYEFYFLRDTGLKAPEILRVMAPSYDYATVIVARRHGWTAAFDNNCRRVKEYIESIAIRPVEIQNLFDSSQPSTHAG